MKEIGYKFARYEKELSILIDLQDSIENTFVQYDLEDLSMPEHFALVTFLTKYEKVLDINELEELKDKVEK